MNVGVSKRLGLVAVSGLALVLAACSTPTTTGGGGGGFGTSMFTKFGNISVSNIGSNRSVSGSFYKTPTAIAAPSSDLATNSCTVTKASATTPPTPPPLPGMIKW